MDMNFFFFFFLVGDTSTPITGGQRGPLKGSDIFGEI